MLLSAVSANLLTAIPNALGGAVGIAIVDASGSIEASAGPIEGIEVSVCEDRPMAVSKSPAHSVVSRELAASRGLLVALVPTDLGADSEALVQGCLDLVQDRDLVEGDFESINATSLALLEEVALLGETLPRLPTGNSDLEVAEIGLEALVRAASCERAIYVEYHRGAEVCSVLAQMGIDNAGRKAVSIPYEGSPHIVPGDNLVWRAMQSDRSVLLETVPANQRLGAPGSPEHLAEQQVIAVPVRYGNDEKRATLGGVLVIDKRARAYSSEAADREFGSQETKLATGVASMMGSVLGMRSVVALDKEMRLAKEIQQQILPDRAADIDGLELAGRCINSGAVGGDYFDYLPMADGRWLTVVADVSGHNLASGMVMVSVRATLRTLAARGTDVAAVFDELASSLYQDLTRSERFLTAVGVALSAADNRIQIVNFNGDSRQFCAGPALAGQLQGCGAIRSGIQKGDPFHVHLQFQPEYLPIKCSQFSWVFCRQVGGDPADIHFIRRPDRCILLRKYIRPARSGHRP